MHIPQSLQTYKELEDLTIVPTQIISPGSCAPIIGIVQDALTGSYLLTRDEMYVSKHDIFNLVMKVPNYQELPKPDIEIKGVPYWSGKTVFSFILPDISYESKNKSKEKVLIENGWLLKGKIDKAIIGEGSSLIQSIFNLYGMNECANFLNSTQQLINGWLKKYSFTVSFGDCITPLEFRETIQNIREKTVKNVDELIQKAQQGLYETKIQEKYIQAKLEFDIRNLISKGDDEAKQFISQNLNSNNALRICLDSGTKGNADNVQRLFTFYGQLLDAQTSQRISNGYTDRTLPHFYKNDISMPSKGFIGRSLSSGLKAHEYFFGSVAARNGQIGKSVLTGDGGYVSRRLMKGMEDLKMHYDGTVRNSNDIIVQFVYANDGFDGSHLEVQNVELIEYDNIQMQKRYQIDEDFMWEYYLEPETFEIFKKQEEKELEICENEFTQIFNDREYLRHTVYPFLEVISDARVYLPIHFNRFMMNMVQKFRLKEFKKSDLLPSMIKKKNEELCQKIIYYYRNKNVLDIAKIMIHDFFSVKRCLTEFHLNKLSFEYMHQLILQKFLEAMVSPGEAVGPLAAQTIGEVNTQESMSSVHGVGKAVKLTGGIVRLNELLKVSKNMKTPSIKIYLKSDFSSSEENIQKVRNKIRFTKIEHLIKSSQILYIHSTTEVSSKEEVEFLNTYFEFNEILGADSIDIKTLSAWSLYLEFEKEDLIDQNVTMSDIQDAILQNCNSENDIQCIFSDDNSNDLMIRIRLKNDITDTNNILFLKELEKQIVQMKLKGITNISDCNSEEVNSVLYVEGGKIESKKELILRTNGTNLYDVLVMEEIDFYRTLSNNIVEVFEIFGIEAARQVLIDELFDNLNRARNIRHMELLADLMTYRGIMMQIDRHGINRSDDNGFIAKSSFEEVTDIFVKAAIFGEKDKMTGVSANIMMGQLCPIGTNFFDVLLDENKIRQIPSTTLTEKIIDKNTVNKHSVRQKTDQMIKNLYEKIPSDVRDVKDTVFDIGYTMQNVSQQKLVFQKPSVEKTVKEAELDSIIDNIIEENDSKPSKKKENTKKSEPKNIDDMIDDILDEDLNEKVEKEKDIVKEEKMEEKIQKPIRKKLLIKKK